MIKAIAVDMDGTFLDDNKQYDIELFERLMVKMKEKEIKFIVASGNQLDHLRSFFPNHISDILFIAENGAKIAHSELVLHENPISSNLYKRIIAFLDSEPIFDGYRLIVSGKKHAYINKNMPDSYKEKGDKFYKNIKYIDDYNFIDDTIYKLAFNFPNDRLDECQNKIQAYFDSEIVAVTSGHYAMDVIASGSGKANALKFLVESLGLTLKNVAAFGDNMNDQKMLDCVTYSYVTSNGKEELKKTAYKVIGSNNEQAVLKEMRQIIETM